MWSLCRIDHPGNTTGRRRPAGLGRPLFPMRRTLRVAGVMSGTGVGGGGYEGLFGGRFRMGGFCVGVERGGFVCVCVC